MPEKMFSGIKSDFFLEFCSILGGKYQIAMTIFSLEISLKVE